MECSETRASKIESAMFYFKRWSRKPFALFKVLGKEVKICALSVGIASVSVPFELDAQNDTTFLDRQRNLDEVVVSAQRSPVVYSKIARVVEVIDKNEIQNLPVQSVNELLRYALSLDVRQRGSDDVQSDVGIRGGTFDQTLVLLNGVNINDPQTGHHNLDLPVDLSSIERIEILEGPGSRVFGPNAFSGAINIITGASKKNYLKLNLLGGDFNYKKANLTSSVSRKNYSSFISIGHRSSDGYTHNTQFDISNAFYQGQLYYDKVKLEAQLGYTEKNFGANSFYTPKYPDQYEATKTIFSSLKAKVNTGNFKFIPQAYYRRHFDRFELFQDNPPSWYKAPNFHRTDVYGLNANSSYLWGWGRSSIGVDFRSEQIRSNKLGEITSDSIPVRGYSDVYYNHKYRRNNLSTYLEHAWFSEYLSVSAGAMLNLNQDIQGIGFYPGIDIAYSVNKNFRLVASINRSLRLPTFTDLFYVGPNNLGNPNLLPEEAISLEGGVKYKQKGIQSSLVVFHRWGNNIIDWVKTSEEEKWMPQNFTGVNTFGIELSSRINFHSIYSNNFFIRSINFSYSYLDVKKESDIYISRYVLDYLKHKFNLTADFRLLKRLGFSSSITYQDRNGSYLYYDFDQGKYAGQKEFEPFFLVDMRLYYQYRNFTFYSEASNVLNTDYVDIGNVTQAGRWFKLGVNIGLDL
ncbi:MAG: TonB-dependent receptor plug domain-containing protein [Bacteroidales bacterium]